MKKLFTLIVAMMAFATSSLAIDYIPEEGVSFQGLFGMNISGLRGSELNPKLGMNFGIKVEYMLPQCYGVFVNAGVNYTMKGARQTVPDPDPEIVKVTTICRPCYVEIPLHVGYRYNLTEDMGIYADFGPYFAIGTNGKNRIRVGEYAEDVTSKFFDRDVIQRFDMGLGFRVGCEYVNQHSLTLGMDWGLTDMYKDKFHRSMIELGLAHPNMKNFNCSVTYGYRF